MSVMAHSDPYTDPRANPILINVRDLIDDKESNEVILMSISRFFASSRGGGGGNRSANDYSPLINDRNFLYDLFFQFFRESITSESNGSTATVNELLLNQRSKVLVQFVHNYREFQLGLLVVLTDLKTTLSLSETLFDNVLKILHQNGVITDDAFNHWFQCKGDFDRRLKSVHNCLKMLRWSQKAREDYFFESNGMIITN